MTPERIPNLHADFSVPREVPAEQATKQKFRFKLEIPSLPWLTPYLPGLILFLFALVITLLTYKDYGVSWDELTQRRLGLLTYDYVFSGSRDLMSCFDRHYGTGFELPLIFFEKWFRLTDTRDILLMRHLVTHIFFLISALSLYILAIRLFKSRFIASLGFVMLAFAPRLYAHSFFNTKDLPFLSMLVVTLMFCQIAFGKNKKLFYFILGALSGYTTSIRILGIMPSSFFLFFLLIDFVVALRNKTKPSRSFLNILSFIGGFSLLLFVAWPFLWSDPVHLLIESYRSFSHYGGAGDFTVLFNGKVYGGENLPWTYIPTWFLISNPEVWLVAGFCGIVALLLGFAKKPLAYLTNTPERNFLLYLMCFFVPVLMVIALHSVLYNDWRHLYFIYPSFVLLALCFIHKIYLSRFRVVVQSVCIVQIAFCGYFMIRNHPFQELYFNNFVSHSPQYLLKSYDLEYWGCSYKQGLEHLLTSDSSKTIKVNCSYKKLFDNKVMLLPEKDRQRLQYADLNDASYFIPHWAGVDIPKDYTLARIDSITVLNSTIYSLFRIEKKPL